MSPSFDTSEPLATPQRLTELAEAIVGAAVSETHWLDWKSSLDFSAPAGPYAVARTIIAFANRDPVVAARVCGGEAYLVVGEWLAQIHQCAVPDGFVPQHIPGRTALVELPLTWPPASTIG
jgi:hypothetical protein